MSIFREMEPFVDGEQILEQPPYSMWCAEVCWDIIMASVIYRYCKKRLSDMVAWKPGYEDKKILELKNGFVSKLKKLGDYNSELTNKNGDYSKSGDAVEKQFKEVISKNWQGTQKINVEITPYTFYVTNEHVGDDLAKHLRLNNPGENSPFHSANAANFCLLTYTNAKSKESHRILICGGDFEEKNFIFYNPLLDTPPYPIALNKLNDPFTCNHVVKGPNTKLSHRFDITIYVM